MSMELRSSFEQACRRHARAIPMADSLLITPLGAMRVGGVPMIVSARDRGIVPHLALSGFWESWVSVWLMKELARGDVVHFLNVGANCGYYAMLAAEAGIRVTAVEPQREHVVNIRDSAHLAGHMARVTVVEAVCSDGRGDKFMKIRVPDLHYMNARVIPKHNPNGGISICGVDVPESEISVPAVTADDIGGDSTLMFADVEGHEPEVWYGTARLRQNPSWRACIEWSPAWYADAPGFLDRVIADGFKFTEICDDGFERPVARDVLLSSQKMVVIRHA